MLCVGAATAVTLLGVMAGTASASGSVTPPFTECPGIGAAPSCEILLVVNPDQTISVLGDPSVGPYDGSDDTLVGILNNSSSAIAAVTVSGTGSGLAGFDGDGICTYSTGGTNSSGFAGDSYCTSQQLDGTDPGDYAGPGTSFTLDPNSQDDVEVDFADNGLAAGGSTYFSLEGALTAAVVTARKGGLNERYVALGDSIPYGHGLANPFPNSQIGLPASAVQQGPSDQAYPGLLAEALHLTLSIRGSNCTLTGDDLAVSSASAASANAGGTGDQCPGSAGWSDTENVQSDELPAAQLARNPATLVTIQAGADDINFDQCMEWDLSKYGAWHLQGTQCVRHGSVTPALSRELTNLHNALVSEIEQAAPYAKHIAVLDYYQAIPKPADFKKSSIFPGGQVDPVCWWLSHNPKGAYGDAVILQDALNQAIVSAVSDAITADVNNVQLIDISNLEAGHEMCTGNPALFSGEPMPKSQFYDDLGVIAACSVYFARSCRTKEPYANQDLQNHVWRTAHPNAYGQQDIARAIGSQLDSL